LKEAFRQTHAARAACLERGRRVSGLALMRRCSLALLAGSWISGICQANTPTLPLVSVQADIGTIFVKEGVLEVKLLGTYSEGRLMPDVELDFKSPSHCTGDEKKSNCGQTFYGYTYKDVSDVLNALDSATIALKSGRELQIHFKMDAAPHGFTGIGDAHVLPKSHIAEITFAEGVSHYKFSLDPDQLVTLMSAVRRANDLREYMKPQFDAFARTSPNIAVKIQEIADPLSGKLALKYDGTSDGSYIFLLENHADHVINFRGEKHFWQSNATPWSASMSCNGGLSSSAETQFPGFIDGPSPDAYWVKLSPGDSLRLTIPKSEVTSAHVGGRCKVELELDNNSKIESNEFSP
jgi:hypothetical protein